MNWQKIKKHDWAITIVCFLLMVLGLLVIFSTTYNTTDASKGAGSMPKQIIFIIIGFIAYFSILSIDFSWFENRSVIKIIYICIILLLLYVKLFGITTAGTNRWIYIGFFSLQPSEYAKIVIILVTAAIFAAPEVESYLTIKRKTKKTNKISEFFKKTLEALKLNPKSLEYLKVLMFNASLVLPLIILTLIQPSLGNAVISFAIWVIILLVLFPNPKKLFVLLLIASAFAFITWNLIFITKSSGQLLFTLQENPNLGLIAGIVLAIMVLAWLSRTKIAHIILIGLLTFGFFGGIVVGWNHALTNYQKTRIETFLAGPESDPTGAGYQVIQSKIAIGSGMLLGRGFLQGTQSSLNVLTQAFTDFVFAAFAEQFGFIGTVIVLSLYLVLILRVIKTGTEASSNFGKYVALGIALLLLLQVFINIGMNLGKLPVTGITLPLMSYGGSSILMTMICLGLVQSINTSRKSVDIADDLMLISHSLVIKEK